MSGFIHLRLQTQDTMSKYFDLTREAQEAQDGEAKAARLIQRTWRGYNARAYMAYLDEQALHIQRTWRGFSGRKTFARAKAVEEMQIRQSYYDSMAVLIQKVFRGFLSRKTREDFHKRSAWLDETRQKSEALRKEMQSAHVEQAMVNAEKAELMQSKKFDKLAENLHHLVSTKAIPGIFNSRFGEMYQITAYDIPMDDHIRDAFRNRREREKMEKEAKQMSKRAARDRRLREKATRAYHKTQKEAAAYQGQRHAQQQQQVSPRVVLPELSLNKAKQQQQTSTGPRSSGRNSARNQKRSGRVSSKKYRRAPRSQPSRPESLPSSVYSANKTRYVATDLGPTQQLRPQPQVAMY